MQPPLPVPFKVPLLCLPQRTQYTQKKKPSSKLRRISETTHMPRPQLVICYLVPFKVGPFHQEGSVRSTSIRCFRLNNVPLSCCHMDALKHPAACMGRSVLMLASMQGNARAIFPRACQAAFEECLQRTASTDRQHSQPLQRLQLSVDGILTRFLPEVLYHLNNLTYRT